MSRDNKLVMLALFLWGSGEGMFLYILPLYMQQLGAAPQQVGEVLAVAALLTACSFIPGGWLADRFDPKVIMIGGWALGGLASIMMGLAGDWHAFIPGLLLYNLSIYCVPAINIYVTEASTAPLAQTITLNFSAFAAGSIVGPFIGGRLSESIGTAPLFLIAGVIFCISMGIALQTTSHARHGHRSSQQPIAPFGAQLKSLRPIRGFLIRMTFIAFATWIGATLAANYLGRLNWTIGDVNTLGGTAQAIGLTVLAISLGRLAAHRQRGGLVLAQLLIFVAMILFLITSPTFRFSAVAGYFLLGSNGALRELANAQIAGQVERKVRGLALGINETLFSLARAAASGLAGVLFTTNVQWPFIASLIAIPIGVILTLLPRPRAPIAAEEIVIAAAPSSLMIDSIDE
jgi:MFS family permease